jgi:hypothetical protein
MLLMLPKGYEKAAPDPGEFEGGSGGMGRALHRIGPRSD